MRAKIALTSTANKLNFSFCISCAIFHVSWSCCLATYSSIPPKLSASTPITCTPLWVCTTSSLL